MRKVTRSPLFMPLTILALLLVLHTIIGLNFYHIALITGPNGNPMLNGSIISVLNNASELAIISIGMALVTAASGGQDISVGAVAAIAGSVFINLVRNGDVTWASILLAFFAACLAAMLCGLFNGMLVAVFKMQPMVATLVLFTAGRDIAYAINGNASPKVYDDITRQIGSFFDGVPVPTPIFIVAIYILLFALILRFTNLRLYIEAVGINEKSARLVGLNPTAIKILAYVLLGLCVAAAGFINSCRMQRLDHKAILLGIEMDAILAVAIGGNALGGGKFSLSGAIIGAYSIVLLNLALQRLSIGPEAIRVYKALFIILLMLASSPVVKSFVSRLFSKRPENALPAKGGMQGG